MAEKSNILLFESLQNARFYIFYPHGIGKKKAYAFLKNGKALSTRTNSPFQRKRNPFFTVLPIVSARSAMPGKK